MRMTRYGSFAVVALALSVAAFAGQTRPKAVTVRGGETGMVGIKLYDTGARVVSVYGNPTEIHPVNFGGGSIGPTGGPAGGGGGFGGGPAGGGRAGRGGGGGAAPSADARHTPDMGFGFGDDMLFQGGRRGTGMEDDMGGGGGRPGMMGPPPPGGFPGGPGGAGAPGGGMGGGNTNAGKIVYTRWIYKRGPAKYGFILDRFNRVVQIEAIGMSDPKVRTSKGIKFGSTFADIIKKYQTPDGYEINGNNIVVRYLVRNKVAFRLSQLAPNKPHTVTGIVVAGGKT